MSGTPRPAIRMFEKSHAAASRLSMGRVAAMSSSVSELLKSWNYYSVSRSCGAGFSQASACRVEIRLNPFRSTAQQEECRDESSLSLVKRFHRRGVQRNQTTLTELGTSDLQDAV